MSMTMDMAATLLSPYKDCARVRKGGRPISSLQPNNAFAIVEFLIVGWSKCDVGAWTGIGHR